MLSVLSFESYALCVELGFIISVALVSMADSPLWKTKQFVLPIDCHEFLSGT